MHKIIIIMKVAFQYHQSRRSPQRERERRRRWTACQPEGLSASVGIFLFFASTLTFVFSIFHHQKQAKPAPAKASVWQKKNERCLDFKRCTDFAQVSPSVVSLLLLILPSLLQCLMLAMNFDNFTLNFIRLVSVSLRHTEPTQHDSQKTSLTKLHKSIWFGKMLNSNWVSFHRWLRGGVARAVSSLSLSLPFCPSSSCLFHFALRCTEYNEFISLLICSRKFKLSPWADGCWCWQ